MRKILFMVTLMLGVSSIGFGLQPATGTVQGNVPLGFMAQAIDPQGPQMDPQQMDLQLHMVEGKLSKVDAQKQLIWIRTKEGLELQFRYTANTAVEGAGDSVEGLANMSGTSTLRVQYTTEGSANTAVKIEILANG